VARSHFFLPQHEPFASGATSPLCWTKDRSKLSRTSRLNSGRHNIRRRCQLIHPTTSGSQMSASFDARLVGKREVIRFLPLCPSHAMWDKTWGKEEG